MRAASVLLVLAIALAGCGSAEPAAVLPSTALPSGPFVNVLVTDPEWNPIPNALVFLEGRTDEVPMDEVVGVRTEQVLTDAWGAARFEAKPGPLWAKAWAPDFYRNATESEAGPNGTVEVQVILERRPPDMRRELAETKEGLCWLAIGSSAGEPASCMTDPKSCPPFSACNGPLAAVALPVDPVLENLTVRLSWDKDDLSQELAFELRLQPAAPFADGSERKIVSGASPLEFEIKAAEIGPEALSNGTTLRIGSVIPAEWERPLIVEQPFLMEAWIGLFYHAPPNPPW